METELLKVALIFDEACLLCLKIFADLQILPQLEEDYKKRRLRKRNRHLVRFTSG